MIRNFVEYVKKTLEKMIRRQVKLQSGISTKKYTATPIFPNHDIMEDAIKRIS